MRQSKCIEACSGSGETCLSVVFDLGYFESRGEVCETVAREVAGACAESEG